jgi:hypothetical protein
MKPFSAGDATSLKTFADNLEIESSEDSVSFMSDFDITRDYVGLALAIQLKSILDATVIQLQADEAAGHPARPSGYKGTCGQSQSFGLSHSFVAKHMAHLPGTGQWQRTPSVMLACVHTQPSQLSALRSAYGQRWSPSDHSKYLSVDMRVEKAFRTFCGLCWPARRASYANCDVVV